MSTRPGLQVENVHVWRGALHVLKGVSLAAAPGELVHLAGPNGVGKTTLLRVASGLLRPEQGAVQWRGHCIRKFRADFQQELAYASHQAALKGDLTALENLEFSVGLKRNVERAQLQASLARTGVAHCAQLPARSLSAGQRRRVALALVLAMQAPLWLLDEPHANLDQEGVELVSQVLAEHVRAGGAAVVVAHGDMAVACPQRRVVLGT